MKKLVFAALLLTLLFSNPSPSIVSADEIPIPEDYALDVGNEFIFVMLSPIDPSVDPTGLWLDEHIRSKYKHSGLYRKDDSLIPVWTLDRYSYEFQIEISSDGNYLIEWELMSYMYSDYDSLGLTLFRSGQEVRSYVITDLVTFPKILSYPCEWKSDSFLDEEHNTLWIKTSTHEEYTIDLSTGEIVKGIKPKTKISLIAIGAGVLALVIFSLLWKGCRISKLKKSKLIFEKVTNKVIRG